MLSTLHPDIGNQSSLASSGCQRQISNSINTLVADKNAPERAALERFIQAGFKRSYQADIQAFMPILVGIGRDKLKAALGIRTGSSALFVEHYLNKPVESVLASQGIQCSRHRIAELGHLLSTSSRYTLPLLVMTATALFQQHISVLVFTATSKLRATLEDNGLPLVSLAEASVDHLPASSTNWGNYYDTSPQVVAVKLSDVFNLTYNEGTANLLYSRVAPTYPVFSAALGEVL